MNDVVIIIPAYNPDDKFITFVKELCDNGFTDIIVVNDGSRKETLHFFDEARELYHCDIINHGINLGQGRAYKSGFNHFLNKYESRGGNDNVIGIIQCDCDGQHCVEDIIRCADLLRQNPDCFILGVRNFSDKLIPFRSRFGNYCTNFVFKVFCGIDIDDTQSGLKGIPVSLIPILMEAPGERFEYASSVLLEVNKHAIKILQFPIHTIYINGNESSHFNPLLDSVRIYSLILKYLLSSLSAFIIDIISFSIFLAITKRLIPAGYIIVSTYLAKIVSCMYSFAVNKKYVFEYSSEEKSTAIKFILLCVMQASLSGLLTVAMVNVLSWREVLCKIIVDTLLFFISFQVQNRWVFKR